MQSVGSLNLGIVFVFPVSKTACRGLVIFCVTQNLKTSAFRCVFSTSPGALCRISSSVAGLIPGERTSATPRSVLHISDRHLRRYPIHNQHKRQNKQSHWSQHFLVSTSSLHLLTMKLIFETSRHINNLSICITFCPLNVLWDALVVLKFINFQSWACKIKSFLNIFVKGVFSSYSQTLCFGKFRLTCLCHNPLALLNSWLCGIWRYANQAKPIHCLTIFAIDNACRCRKVSQSAVHMYNVWSQSVAV